MDHQARWVKYCKLGFNPDGVSAGPLPGFEEGSTVEFEFIEEIPADDPSHPEPGSTRRYARYDARCLDPGGTVVGVGVSVPVPMDEAVDTDALRDQARARIIYPLPEAGTPRTHAYYQLPTWLWVDPVEPVTASAGVGAAQVSVTARPIGTTWTMGDGKTHKCDGLGTPWEPGLPETAATCSYTYTTIAEPQFSVALVWELTFEFQGQPLGDPETVNGIAETFDLPVGEIQTIITN